MEINDIKKTSSRNINTDGWVVIWTNNKLATNNYQVRISATYLLS